MIDQHKQAFKEEAAELMVELEQTLLELEKDNNNKDLIGKAFRGLHTIKGSGGMFGYEDLSVFVHDIESVFERIRNGEMQFNKEIADLTLSACDQINAMIFEERGVKVDDNEVKRIVEIFRKMNLSEEKEEVELKVEKKLKEKGEPKIYSIYFEPQEDIFSYGNDPIYILKDLNELGETVTVCKLKNEINIESLNPEKLYFYWQIILRSHCSLDTLRDVFIFVEDLANIDIKEIKITGDISKNIDDEIEKLLLKKNEIKDSDIQQLYTEVEEKKILKGEGIGVQEGKSIRVSSDKLDELVNLVGELVTVQAGLSQLVAGIQNPLLHTVSEQIERLTWDLRDSTLNIRMLPIGTTFSKFNRLVRDLSKDLKKEVELTTSGAETELDKSIIEKLSDPLVHILRNSIDHGIESPQERIEKGKERKGMIHLAAKQAGGNVIIQITDDGAGINKKAVRDKAIKSGVITEESELSEQELLGLIFKAGFSTSSKITNVSGRGVGMDVVKQAIDNLRGTVEIESTEDEGTTISLKLPLTLAIIDGLLVEVGEDYFVIPLYAIEECVEINADEESKRGNRHFLNIREEIVPYIKLREQFNVKGNNPFIEQVIIVNIEGFRVGFVVDEVKGQHQTVLKSLGGIFKNVEGVSGATILGDGNIALILDIQKLAAMEMKKEQEQFV